MVQSYLRPMQATLQLVLIVVAALTVASPLWSTSVLHPNHERGFDLRMTASGESRIIAFPDDTHIVFEPDPVEDFFRLARIEDAHGNFVAVSYTATSWTISDSHGRSQVVEFVDHDLLDDWESKVVSRVVLESSDGGGAEYNFQYTSLDLVRACPNNDAELKNPLSIPVLQVLETASGRLMKELFYYHDNASGEWRFGQAVQPGQPGIPAGRGEPSRADTVRDRSRDSEITRWKNTLDNAQNTCRTCNRRKAARTTEEFLEDPE